MSTSSAKVPVWVWLLIAGGVGLVAMVTVGSVVAGAAFFMASRPAVASGVGVGTSGVTTQIIAGGPEGATGGGHKEARKTFTRDEVKAAWALNRTEEFLQERFGRPDNTTEIQKPWRIKSSDPLVVGSSGFTTVKVYHYKNLSVDPASGKIDAEAIITLDSETPPRFVP